MGGDVHFVEEDAAGFLADAAEDGVADGAGLLKDFLEHEVFVAALFGHDGVPEDMGDLAADGAAVEAGEVDAFGGEDGEVAVVQEEHVAGVAEDGGDVGGDEIFAFAEADDDGRAGAGGDDLVGVGGGDDGEGEDAGELEDGFADGVLEAAVEMLLDQVGDDFGVGLGDEVVAFELELVFEGEVVFDDAVVDDDDVAGAVAMGMGVLLRGAAVGGPAGVADAVGAIDGADADGLFEVAQFAGGAADAERVVGAEHGDARRIVAAIFKAAEAVEDDGHRFAIADVANNAAHIH